jgi:hypothetical protein
MKAYTSTFVITGILLSILIGTVIYFGSHWYPLNLASIESLTSSQPTIPSPSKREIFDEHIAPYLEKLNQENLASLQRGLNRIEQLFDSYAEHTDEMVNELMSFGSRCQILSNMRNDWWN